MKKLILLAILFAVAYIGLADLGVLTDRPDTAAGPGGSTDIHRGVGGDSLVVGSDCDLILSAAFDRGRSNLQVRGRGEVIRLLADDNDGSRHQRFIIRLASGQTLLVAHNIDLASRVARLDVGDQVEFHGEYEWNPQGGVIHWTHHDPRGRHVAGWLKHGGWLYQ